MKPTHAMKTLALSTLIGVIVGAAPARADEATEPLRVDFPRPENDPALRKWRAEHPWRYDTGYLFGVTRGLETAVVSRRWRPALWIVTVPFDLVNLPVAAVAGLFGD